jgi:hypothetical protein
MRPSLGDSAPWVPEGSNMRGHGCLGASDAHRAGGKDRRVAVSVSDLGLDVDLGS